MAIKHTKDRQRVWNFYQDPIRFHPAKVWEFGRIKIKTYPQESCREGELRNDYKGILITINLRRPRRKPIGWFYFDLHINNGEGLIKRLGRRLGKRFGKKSIPVEDSLILEQPTTNDENSDSVS